MTTTQQNPIDAMDAAMDAKFDPSRVFFGQVNVDAWHCVLVKGVGKQQFDPNQHPEDQRRTTITIEIYPLPSAPNAWNLKRDFIAESTDWTKIVLPSLKFLKTNLKEINGKWAKVTLIPSGRKYTDPQTHTEKESTIPRFEAIYQTQDECQAANDAHWKKPSNGNGNSTPVAAPANGSDAERQTAAKFLTGMWTVAGKDREKFAQLIATNPILAKHFTMESPEVQALIAA